MEARYNIAPGTPSWVVRIDQQSDDWFGSCLWGLVPSWAKDPQIGLHPINARSETVSEKPMFRKLLKERRCLVPADGYYEWKKSPTGKTPYWIRMANDEPFFFAGLMDCWHPESPDQVSSFAIITTEANERTVPIHNRMPVIVRKEDYNLWLDLGVKEQEKVAHVMRPYPAGEMIAYPVSTKVNNVKNEGPELLEPAR